MSNISNMSFARKYRPTDFDTYVGNEVSKRKVLNMLAKGRVPQSMIFEGDRGCGKTTLARLVGKALLCKDPKEDGTPCEKCNNCVKISEKFILEGGKVSGVPIQEVDINSEGNKDDILSLIQDMRVKPMGNSKKVYILDEVQVMPTRAQSSLLKVLEEPNPWLYIILCTTDPEDLLEPIISRLTPFKIRRPGIKEVSKRLKQICLMENIKHDDKALELIVKLNARIPRESIKSLETISSSGDVTYETVQRDLQMVKIDTYIDYINVLRSEIFDALEFINNLYDKYNIEIEAFLDGLSEFVVDAFNIKTGVSLEKYTEEEAKRMKTVFKTMSMRELIKLLNLIGDSLKLKNNPKYALTMLTLKMGFPDYFEPEFTQSSVAQDIAKENSTGIKNYKKNKEDHEKSLSNVISEELTEDMIASLFPDSYVVE